MLAENKNFWTNLTKIQNALLKSDKEFSQFLDINYDLFVKQKKTLSFLPLNCVFELAEKLNFHFEDLVKESFSTKGILSQIQGNYSLLEKYSVATYGKTRHIANVIKYLEYSRGERAKINFMRKFQLTEDFILKGNNSTNILLTTDIMNYLKTVYNFQDADYIRIGQMTPFTNMNKDVEEALLQKKNIHETFAYFFDELAMRFDKNFSYSIAKLQGDSAIIEAKPNRHVVEELQAVTTEFGSENACLTRMGLISSIAWFKYRTFTPPQKITSLYSGSSTNLYKFDFSSLSRLSNVRNLNGPSVTVYH